MYALPDQNPDTNTNPSPRHRMAVGMVTGVAGITGVYQSKPSSWNGSRDACRLLNPNPAFPQQLLQITKTFSLRPPTFLSTKTNELTLIVPNTRYLLGTHTTQYQPWLAL